MAGVKYHINPKTGRPNQCTATVRGCAYAKDGMVPEHYDSKEEAQLAYEKQNKENTFKKLTKNTSTRNIKIASTKGNKGISGKMNVNSTSLANKSTATSSVHVNDDGFIIMSENAYSDSTVGGKTATYDVGDGIQVTLPSDYDVSQINYEEYKYAADNLEERFAQPGGDNYHMRKHQYSEGIARIDEYKSPAETGVVFDSGQYYYPTPDEPYHGSDRKYTKNPSFYVENREIFTKYALSGYKEDTGIDVKFTPELENDLDSNRFYESDSYEPVIGWHYYGDEFEGFKADEYYAKNWSKIIAIHSIAQMNNSAGE